jgi:hypothetical protein
VVEKDVWTRGANCLIKHRFLSLRGCRICLSRIQAEVYVSFTSSDNVNWFFSNIKSL